MAPTQGTGDGAQQAELGALLVGAVDAVVGAQDALDAHARRRAAEYAASEPGSLALPPLWYTFDAVGIELELSSEVVRTRSAPDAAPVTRLLCRTVNPVTAGVFGYTAATGTRVRLTLVPQRMVAGPASPSPSPTPEGPPS